MNRASMYSAPLPCDRPHSSPVSVPALRHAPPSVPSQPIFPSPEHTQRTRVTSHFVQMTYR
jgi:hypothetical protein